MCCIQTNLKVQRTFSLLCFCFHSLYYINVYCSVVLFAVSRQNAFDQLINFHYVLLLRVFGARGSLADIEFNVFLAVFDMWLIDLVENWVFSINGRLERQFDTFGDLL